MNYKIVSTPISKIKRLTIIDQIKNGGIYEVSPHLKTTPNFFYRIAEFDDIFLKQPSVRVLNKFGNFLIEGDERPHIVDVRESFFSDVRSLGFDTNGFKVNREASALL